MLRPRRAFHVTPFSQPGGKWAAVLIILLSLLVTAAVWGVGDNYVEDKAHASFDKRVELITSLVQERLVDYRQVLRGGLALVKASDVVTREEWRTFVSFLALERSYPGIQGVGFSLRVQSGDLDSHIKAIRDQGYPHYVVTPEGERAEYYPTVYLEPFTDRNLRAFGYDMFSDATRRAAMERARDTADNALSGKVRLVQEADVGAQAGFLMYLPVYRNGQPIKTFAQRRDALVGFVYSPFRMGDFMRGILGQRELRDVSLEIFDGGQMTLESRMYDSEPGYSVLDKDYYPMFSRNVTFEFGGRPWNLQFMSTPAFEAAIDHSLPNTLLVGGLFFTLLMGFYIYTRHAAEVSLTTEKERIQVTLESIGDAVITTDMQGCVEYLNPTAESLTGVNNIKARGLPLQEVFNIINDRTRERAPNPVETVLKKGKATLFADNTVLIRDDGSEFAIEDSAAPIKNRKGEITGVVLVFHDVSYARKLAKKLSHQARHDALTGLANRREFERRLELALASASSESTQHTLLYLDLDQFKIVNDTSGHVAGDELLSQVTGVLQAQLRKHDLLARLGGDEFGVLLESCTPQAGIRIAETLRKAVGDFRFSWEQKSFNVSVSIGLVSFGDASFPLADLLSAADTACYIAKDKGRNRIHVYDREDSDLALRHGEMEWVARIHKAFEEQRFRLCSQDIVALAPQTEPGGVYQELLLRLLDEEGSLVLPMAFIPAAERYNLMPSIDRWVISNAFVHCAHLLAEHGPGGHKWAINLSGASLADEYFLGFVREQFVQSGLPYETICFEITETVAISNFAKTGHFISELKALGCCFALDGFGSGLSSFTYLKHLPVNFLKINGAFVKDMVHDPIDLAMVESINNIGHIMGIKTIAESVENKQILAKLKDIGVDFVQGYGVAKLQPFFDPSVVRTRQTTRKEQAGADSRSEFQHSE